MSLAFIWDVTSPRWNRRTFIKTMGFAAAAGFVAASCGSDSGSKSSSGTPAAGSSAPEAKQLNFYNWTEYINKKAIPNFEQRTGINVTYDNYSSNDELFAKISSGGTGYDIIVPTDGTLVKMKNAGFLEKLDLAKIPNVANLDDRFRNAEYDPGNQYSIPWQWGTTGIGYDPTKVGQKVTDWEEAFNLPSVQGKSSFLDEARDAFSMALFALHKDPNTLDTGDLDAAKDYLIDLKKKVKSITSDYQDPLKGGELILAQAYSGDVFQAQADNDKLEYVIPSSGANSWVDAMAIPKGAKHPNNAHEFMNYMLEPEVGAALDELRAVRQPEQGGRAADQEVDHRQSADLPAARSAGEAAVREGPGRGRGRIRRPVDRGEERVSERRERRSGPACSAENGQA